MYRMDNTKLMNEVNQLFHNKCVKQESRFNLLIDLLEKSKNGTIDNTFQDIQRLMASLDYSNKDLIQEIFMLLGSKFTKYKLDQFYTPLTISQFICNLMISNNDFTAIDPAGGTGDLLLYYNGNKTIWDIDEDALKLCKFNYELNKQTNYSLICKNSLSDFEESIDKYSYVTMNPPFGSNTVVTDKKILDNFELGKGKKKQEIGILFIELALKLLKTDGIMFAIVPSGYLGNANNLCSELRNLLLKNTVMASIELPKNTFKRSGTGVATYLVIVKKTNHDSSQSSNNIFIDSPENIGYNLTKKETPLKYRIEKSTGVTICDDNGKHILDNDLNEVHKKLATFCLQNGLTSGVKIVPDNEEYESINRAKIVGNILDIKRYKKNYMDVVHTLTNLGAIPVNKLSKIVSKNTKIERTNKYKYIDIGEINSPFYSYKDLYGWELPSRAKYTLKKYDLLVSKLEGSMSYCIILDESPNYICTNGVTVLRPNDQNSLYILLANIMKKEFCIQHNAYLTGSIMASLTDTDIGNILIDSKTIDVDSTRKIVDALEQLQALRM